METTTTTTTTGATTAAAAQAASRGEHAITTTGTVASLPPCLLWAASLAASDDTVKGVICSIDVRRARGGGIRIAATDGCRLFRVVIPESEHFWIAADQTEPFRLNPKAFGKAANKRAATVAIEASGVATFADRLGRPVDAAAWQPDTVANAVGQTYPNVDQVWPEDSALSCDPGEMVAFNPYYVSDFAKIAEKLTDNPVMRLRTCKRAVSPCVMEAVLDLAWLLCENKGTKAYPSYAEDPVMLQYLIMPVQIRKA